VGSNKEVASGRWSVISNDGRAAAAEFILVETNVIHCPQPTANGSLTTDH